MQVINNNLDNENVNLKNQISAQKTELETIKSTCEKTIAEFRALELKHVSMESEYKTTINQLNNQLNDLKEILKCNLQCKSNLSNSLSSSNSAHIDDNSMPDEEITKSKNENDSNFMDSEELKESSDEFDDEEDGLENADNMGESKDPTPVESKEVVPLQPVKICTGCHIKKTYSEFSKKGERLRACCSTERRVDSELAKRCRENKELAVVNQKRCNTCNAIKHKDDFYKTGPAGTCIECAKAIEKQKRAEQPASDRALITRENKKLKQQGLKKCQKCSNIKNASDFYRGNTCKACFILQVNIAKQKRVAVDGVQTSVV